MRLLLIALASTVLFSACPAPAPTLGEPAVILRAYEVPPALASETQSVLSSLLYRGKDVPKLGSVVLSPTGQVLVSAPASFHQGVAQVVARLGKDGPKKTPGVDMEYVLVLGRAGTPSAPAGLTPAVTTVLEQVAKAEGYEMRVFDRLMLSSVSGDRAELRDTKINVRQTATVHGDKVIADIELHGQEAEVRAKVKLIPGKPLVIARAGYTPRPGEAFFEDGKNEALALFYVLSAKVNEAE